MSCSKFGSLQLLAVYAKNNMFTCGFVHIYVKIYFNSVYVINRGTEGTKPPMYFFVL